MGCGHTVSEQLARCYKHTDETDRAREAGIEVPPLAFCAAGVLRSRVLRAPGSVCTRCRGIHDEDDRPVLGSLLQGFFPWKEEPRTALRPREEPRAAPRLMEQPRAPAEETVKRRGTRKAPWKPSPRQCYWMMAKKGRKTPKSLEEAWARYVVSKRIEPKDWR